jgi:IclR family pca regulon transcriptional regulator
VTRWLAKRRLVLFTPYTVTTHEGIRELIEAARRKGYALLEQQFERRLRGIAVPIRNRNAETVGAISVSLPIDDETSEQALARSLPLLREAEYSLLALL